MSDNNERKQERIDRRNAKYNEYVEKVTPKHSCLKNSFNAFICGGLICCLGQVLLNVFSMYCSQESAATYTTISLILISVILTALNIYPSITKWGGAGALVPITGFANSVCAPAIEFGAEGQVFGIGCKIFTIAGPVILFGVFSSWLVGLIYWIMKISGIV